MAHERPTQNIVLQEGAILCPSRSTAMALAAYARDEIGPTLARVPVVTVGEYTFARDWVIDRETASAFAKVNAVFSRKGRRPAARQYVVTCVECLTTDVIETHAPTICPACSGIKIHWRVGETSPHFTDDGRDVIDLWVASRHAGTNAHMEASTLVDEFGPTKLPATASVNVAGREQRVVDEIARSPLADTLRKMPRIEALTVLDAVIAARAYAPAAHRQKARAQTVTKLFTQAIGRGDTPPPVIIGEIVPDLLDAAHLLGEDAAIAWFTQYND
jgi:hypothetical protein